MSESCFVIMPVHVWAPTKPNCTFEVNQDCAGYDFSVLGGSSSANACCNQRVANAERCVALGYRRNELTCYLKFGAPAPKFVSGGYTSGIRIQAQQG